MERFQGASPIKHAYFSKVMHCHVSGLHCLLSMKYLCSATLLQHVEQLCWKAGPFLGISALSGNLSPWTLIKVSVNKLAENQVMMKMLEWLLLTLLFKKIRKQKASMHTPFEQLNLYWFEHVLYCKHNIALLHIGRGVMHSLFLRGHELGGGGS